METIEHNALCTEIRHPYSYGDQFTYLLLSDLHFDNPLCDRNTLFRLMDEAVDRDAKIIINGDLFCMMQARNDKRHVKSAVRKEHMVANYFDAVIQDTAELFEPYKDHIILMGDGNHETAITKRKEINPLGLLKHRMNADYGAKIIHQGYHGYVIFTFDYKATGGKIRRKIMYRHHGKYTGQVTMGVLGVKRHQVAVEADIYWTGHTHNLWHVTTQVAYLNAAKEVRVKDLDHVKTGSFKQEFDQPGGFGVEKLAEPKAIGGYWMTFAIPRRRGNDVQVRFTQAK